MNSIDKSILDKHDKIIFGPFLGELGWEIRRWSGFVRWYKKNNPEKEIIAATRNDRTDLYYGTVDEIITVNIEDDYNQYRPNMYRLENLPNQMKQNILNEIRQKYKNHYIFETPWNTNNRELFDINEMDLNYTPSEESQIIIDNCIKLSKKRIPIVISSRHRFDLESFGENSDNVRVRNWKIDNWNKLIEGLDDIKRYLIFIAGKSPAYVIPDRNQSKTLIVLEDLIRPYDRVSIIGLTIEAIKRSKLTIGQQSAIPILSNLLKTPTLMWGDEKQRHQVIENPYKTECTFIEEQTSNYVTKPELIIHNVMEMTKKGK